MFNLRLVEKGNMSFEYCHDMSLLRIASLGVQNHCALRSTWDLCDKNSFHGDWINPSRWTTRTIKPDWDTNIESEQTTSILQFSKTKMTNCCQRTICCIWLVCSTSRKKVAPESACWPSENIAVLSFVIFLFLVWIQLHQPRRFLSERKSFNNSI